MKNNNMTVAEYKTELERIEKEIQDLKQKHKETEMAYITDHSPFVITQKVLVTMEDKTTLPAFIKSINISWENKIEYRFAKCKLDGTASLHELWGFKVKEIKPFN